METVLTISLLVSIDEPSPNLNEICAAVRQSVVRDLAPKVVEEVIEEVQGRVVETLCSPSGRVAKKGLGAHPVKGDSAHMCPGRSFRRQGHRSRPRMVKTDLGLIDFPVAYVECRGCGKKFAPILELLGLESRSRHTGSLERVAMEAVSQTSFARGEADIEARGCPPVPRSSAHRWLAGQDLPESPWEDLSFGMADGTAFKKWPGERGHLLAVIGLTKTGRLVPMGCYAGTSWEEIGKGIRGRLREEGVQLELFATDGEVELDDHLAGIGRRAQRCIWHIPRGLGYALWKDEVALRKRRRLQKEVAGLVGIELPEGEWELVGPEDRRELWEAKETNRKGMEELALDFKRRGYEKAATYLERAVGRIFSHVELWLETGVVAPRTTSILENVMRELGRRVKKLGWNWRDPGVAQMSQIVMLRRYDPKTWEAWWRDKLGLRGRCRITIQGIDRSAA